MKFNYTNFGYHEWQYTIYRKFNTLKYHIKKIFFPWNVLTLHDLPNEYCDRDWVMFHAIFQCVVDFVELEHDLLPYKKRPKSGRCTDIALFEQYLTNSLTPEGLATYYGDWYTEEEKKRSDEQVTKQIQTKMEILYLYSWYKAKAYIFNNDLILNTPPDLSSQFNTTTLLTANEYFEKEQEHDIVCNKMLERVLKIRKCLWT